MAENDTENIQIDIEEEDEPANLDTQQDKDNDKDNDNDQDKNSSNNPETAQISVRIRRMLPWEDPIHCLEIDENAVSFNLHLCFASCVLHMIQF